MSAQTVIRAIEIGKECAAINTAIDEAKTAHGNYGYNHGKNPFEIDSFYESKLFKELSARREALREELRVMG